MIGRNTAFTYKGKAVDLKQIGRELNVRYVLEGSVQRSGNRMRVNVQLIDAESGHHLWAERFDKTLADLFDMQDEIVARVAGALNTELVAAEARRAEQAESNSMDFYFQGRAWFNKGMTPDNVPRARSFFDRAVAADPNSADALFVSAAADAVAGALFYVTDPVAAFTSAEARLTKALSSVPDHGRGHMTLGFVYIYTKRGRPRQATGAASRPNAGDTTASRQRVKLQVDYSEAIMYYNGFSAEETRVAWARAAEIAANRDDFSERSAVRHAQWTLAIVRGELHAAQELASTFLCEAEEAGRPVETGVARRSLGVICYYSGDFLNARIHCERALDACRHERDFEARERFSDDTGAVAMSILAITSWQLGEVERASELINMANHRAAELGHAPSKVHPLYWKSILEILRGDAAAALITGEALEGLCEEHGMGEWRAVAEMVVGWAHGRLSSPTAGAAEMQQALAVLINKGMRIVVVFFQGLLADLELETLGADSAVVRIDEALVSADQSHELCIPPLSASPPWRHSAQTQSP